MLTRMMTDFGLRRFSTFLSEGKPLPFNEVGNSYHWSVLQCESTRVLIHMLVNVSSATDLWDNDKKSQHVCLVPRFHLIELTDVNSAPREVEFGFRISPSYDSTS